MEQWFLQLATLWGAGLSTLLGLIQIRNQLRDKAVLRVSAEMVFTSFSEDSAEYGTRIKTDNPDGRDYPTEAYVEVIVTNHGRRAVQIVSTFVEYEDGKVHQISGRNLPIVLEPNCQVASAIQKEWLDDPSAQTVGVLDALGKRHSPAKRKVRELIARSRSLPSNRREYVKKDDPAASPVWAWQVRDPTSLSLKDKSVKISQSMRPRKQGKG